MRKLYKTLILVLSVQMFCPLQAFAISKLGSFADSATEYLTFAEERHMEGNEYANTYMQEYLQYKAIANPAELQKMALGYVQDYLGDYLEQGMGYVDGYVDDGLGYLGDKFDAGLDYVSGNVNKGAEFVGGKLQQGQEYVGGKLQQGQEYVGKKMEQGQKYVKKKTDYALASKKKKKQMKEAELAAKQAAVEDYKKAKNDEKLQKVHQIDVRIQELNAKMKGASDDERKKLEEEVSDLEGQKQSVLDDQIEDDPQYQKLTADADKLKGEVDKMAQEQLDNLLGGISDLAQGAIHGSSGSGDVFADDDQEDTKSIYETEIEALFLKEDEISSSENLARIKYNRAREYYNAIKNAMVIAVNSGSKSVQIEQKVGQYAEMGGKTEGNAALKNVNVGVMIQKAKAAGRLTEALLAEMRLKTTQDMVSWNNKYHLYDYKKPVTIFEFDSYALKKSDLKNQAMSLLKDQIGGMWHKL